ncbi:cytochrome c oxidase assembly factor Coa1 family protein [Pyxidicoccus xibeiensis]|uniref:cytochrome c oxidase assembly factor Coa1 family protein n=1 Tax=Pyxidicoccus xibeiensis TaxID=2906759 RepID=UPI0020A7367E|nr:cytochrome c oxidase assembly factor Coa1 family protein [Pyxidicoccus xibeiensis]MCP3144286.1 cytochrome c oxidase assembly factor 1 family protein [Pyxidicoccus xibeiensis]
MDRMPEGSMAPQRGWWSRNWKWMVPVGCLGVLASCGCLGAMLVGTSLTSILQGPPRTEAEAIATSDEEVRARLGPPIDVDWPRESFVHKNNGRTRAKYSIPLDGAKADGTLHVEAEQDDGGPWRYSTLEVELEDGTRIDLRDVANPAPRDAPAEDFPPPTPKAPVPPELPLGDEPPGRDGAQEEAPPREGGSDIEL